MKIPNINCKHYNGYGFCKKLPKTFFGIFKQECCEVNFKLCNIATGFKKPKTPPPAPKQKCSSCINGYDGTNGNGYQPCGCNINKQPNKPPNGDLDT